MDFLLGNNIILVLSFFLLFLFFFLTKRWKVWHEPFHKNPSRNRQLINLLRLTILKWLLALTLALSPLMNMFWFFVLFLLFMIVSTIEMIIELKLNASLHIGVGNFTGSGGRFGRVFSVLQFLVVSFIIILFSLKGKGFI